MRDNSALADSVKAFIFDLDGVLWQSNQLHEKAFIQACVREKINPIDYEKIAGKTTPEAWKKIAAHNSLSFDKETISRLTRLKRSLFIEFSQKVPVGDDDLDLIANKFPDKKWAIVTGASRKTLDIFLQRTRHRDSFNALISADDGLPSKPSPTCYKRSFEKLDMQPKECAIFEDSISGLSAAESSGASVIHITNSETPCEDTHRSKMQYIACLSSVGKIVTL